MKKQKYITTPLYYVNAQPHLGHYYTTLLADVVKRHYTQRGQKVLFLTGTDEHGEKVEQMAKNSGVSVKSFVDDVAQKFKETWQDLKLDFDIFYRTTQEDHAHKVRHALQFLKDKGDIVFREYEGNYCVGCERFLTDSELNTEGKCQDHQTKPEPRKEANYFFLMSRYQTQLIEHIEAHPDFIEPRHFRNEVLSFLKQPLGDLCISRPKSRLTWGINLPFDDSFVTYVWFDALLNYTNALNWPDHFQKDLWQTCHHFVGKDILKTHAIYWPTMLMALGIPMFKTLQVGGYWLMSGNKMSKSLGNVLRPKDVEDQFGRETLRFYLLKDMAYGQDSSFTIESFVNCTNAHLANGIGNLVARILTLCQKYFLGHFDEKSLTEKDRDLIALRDKALATWNESFEDYKYQNATKAWCELVSQVDLYMNDNKPWMLAKDPAAQDRLQTVLGVGMLMISSLGALIYPVLPQAAMAIGQALGLDESYLSSTAAVTNKQFSFSPPASVPKLFARVQVPTE